MRIELVNGLFKGTLGITADLAGLPCGNRITVDQVLSVLYLFIFVISLLTFYFWIRYFFFS